MHIIPELDKALPIQETKKRTIRDNYGSAEITNKLKNKNSSTNL